MRLPTSILLLASALALGGCVFVHRDEPPPRYDHGPSPGYDRGPPPPGYERGPPGGYR